MGNGDGRSAGEALVQALSHLLGEVVLADLDAIEEILPGAHAEEQLRAVGVLAVTNRDNAFALPLSGCVGHQAPLFYL